MAAVAAQQRAMARGNRRVMTCSRVEEWEPKLSGRNTVGQSLVAGARPERPFPNRQLAPCRLIAAFSFDRWFTRRRTCGTYVASVILRSGLNRLLRARIRLWEPP